LQIHTYDELRSWEKFPSGTYLFTDFGAMDAAQMAWARELWDRVAQEAAPVRMLNNPHRVLGRYDLLRVLHGRGINSYRAYRLHEAHRARFPVFLRSQRTIRTTTAGDERTHWGVTRLLRSRRELVRAVGWWARRGWPTEELLVVEFVDTATAEGLYPKYAAFYVAGRVIPRNLVFQNGWVVKPGNPARHPNEAHLALEREFLETNPHESLIREVFAAARTDYGRVDYSMQNGRPTVWEINWNPQPLSPKQHETSYLHPNLRLFSGAYCAALEELDTMS
jgi:hypothetical protein